MTPTDVTSQQSLTQRLANPTRFMQLSGTLMPWVAGAAAALILYALYLAFFVAPEDYQQGQTVKIMFIHVPAAWLAMMGYALIAISSFGYLVFRHPLADVSAKAAAPIGAAFTFLALATGSLWGKPMWGTYWEWDPRLTAELILLFLYFGYMGLRGAFENLTQADRASAVLAIAGVVNVPIIHFSVIWWASLHQGPTLSKLEAPSISGDMLWPLLTMILAFTLFFLGILAMRVRAEVLEREVQSRWAQDMLRGASPVGVNS